MLVWILVGAGWARPQCTSDGGWGCLELADVASQLDRDRRAERLRDKACTAKHPEACGPLWERDPEAANIAIDAAREACTVGGASAACRRLARLHQRGPRPLRDFAEARRLLTVACDLDDGRACDRLAVAWERIGPDDPTDHVAARAAYERACRLGRAESCRALAWRRIRGVGGPVDVTGAYESLEKACADEDYGACEDLGAWRAEGRGRSPDPAGAAAAWAEACDLWPERCAALVERARDAALPTEPFRPAVTSACADEVPEACGAMLLLGLDEAPEHVATIHESLLDEARGLACRHGDAATCDALAESAEPGFARRLRLQAATLRARAARHVPWPTVSAPDPWVPEPGPLAECLDRHVKQLADPRRWGRGTPSPFYDDSADLVAAAFADAGLDVERPEVLVPPSDAPSWVMVSGQPHRAFAIPGTPGGVFRGRARVLDAPPTPGDLDDLADVAVMLFSAPRFEAAAADRFVVARVPVLAVQPEIAARARAVGEVRGVARTARAGERVTNVLGVLPGRGALADEIVVLGAHLDAQSFVLLEGAVRPGADDNASGVAGVLCAADVLSRELAEASDRRTLVFAAYGAEERGLYGSRSHAGSSAPVAMLNLDMIGRLGDRPVEVRAYGSDWPGLLQPAARELDVELVDGDQEGLSDHFPFALAGAPAAMLSSGLHGDYHAETDTADRVDLPGTTRIASIATSAVRRLATGARPQPADDPCTELTEEPLGAGLGLEVMEAYDLPVRCVRQNSLAEALGIAPGDRILAVPGLDDWPIEPVSAFVERGGTCFELDLGQAPVSRPCESAP